LEREGRCTVTRVPVQTDGRVKAQDVVDAITDDTVLVTVMLANNESGALMPVREISKVCKERGIWMHTDAAQAAGKVDVAVPCDMMTLVGHKIGAPKGIAALYVSSAVLQKIKNEPLLLKGGGQEFGRRGGGTENVPYIVGMGKAAELVLSNLDKNHIHMKEMRALLLNRLTEGLGKEVVKPNGPASDKDRLPNTLSVGLKGIQSSSLPQELSEQVAASAGAACHSSGGGISSILHAMKVPEEFALGTLRLSVGPTTTSEDIERAAALIVSTAKAQLSSSGGGAGGGLA